MDYFTVASDEISSETNTSNDEQDMETSDYRPYVRLHHKIVEKPKSKSLIRIGRRKNSTLSSRQSNDSLSSSKNNSSLSSSKNNSSLSSSKNNSSLSSSKNNGSLSSSKNNGSLSSSKNNGSLSSSKNNGSLSSNQNIGSFSNNPNQNNGSLSSNQIDGSRSYDVSERPSLPHISTIPQLRNPSTTKHQKHSRLIKVYNNLGDVETREQIREKCASMVANLQLGKKCESKLRLTPVSRLLTPTKDSDRPSDCVAQPKTVRQSLLTPLDNCSSRPMMRREQFEKIGVEKSDVDPPDSGLGQDACSPPTRASSEAVPGPADRIDCFKPPQKQLNTRGGQDKKKVPRESSTIRKVPPTYGSKVKQSLKRNKLKDKLDTNDGNLHEEEEEPPKKKASPEKKSKTKPNTGCVVYEPTTNCAKDGSLDESDPTDVNFKKPLLPLPKNKVGAKNGGEPISFQEEKLEGKPHSDLAQKSLHAEEEAQVSASPNVSDKRKEEVRQEELIEKRYLNKWVPFLRNKKLYIEGDLINFASVTPSDMSSKWTTSKIVSRISDKQVGTKKTCYVLEGQLAIPAPGERPIPLFVIDKFRNGFPENWKNVIEHWIHFNDLSLVTEVTNQTILNNISTISMTLFNSTPMPGMMSNMNVSDLSCIPNVFPSFSKTPVKIAGEHSPSRIIEEPVPSRIVEGHSPSRVAGEDSPSRVAGEHPPSRVSIVERPLQVNTQEHEEVTDEGSGRKEELCDSIQERPPDQEKYKLSVERKSRSKVVKHSANRSTKSKQAQSKTMDSLSSSANTIIVDGIIKYPCEHCDYVGLQLRHLNTHKRKHKNSKTVRSHSNSKVVKSRKIVHAGTNTRSLSESSVADMKGGTSGEKQAKEVNEPKDSNDEKSGEKICSQAENTTKDKNSSERTESVMTSNKTMTLCDFAQLTHARSYPNTKMVQRQKFYLCQFCHFECTIFKQLKDHLKKIHVDSENNEPDSSLINFSSNSHQIKPQLKSPTVTFSEELLPAGPSEQETSIKRSRFGRKLVKNTSLSRTSWIEATHSHDVYETKVTEDSKQASGKKLVPTKRNLPQSEQKGPFLKKKSIKKNQVMKKAVENPSEGHSPQPSKTAKDKINNSDISKEFNVDHEDDMFGSSARLDPKEVTGEAGTQGHLGSLDDNHSDNDISLHSNRIPVMKYNRKVARGNGVTAPILRMAKNSGDRSGSQLESGVEQSQLQSYVEQSQQQSDVEQSQLHSGVEQSSRIIGDMAGQSDAEDEEEPAENSFNDTQSVQFFCDPNPALMKLFKERELRRNEQKYK